MDIALLVIVGAVLSFCIHELSHLLAIKISMTDATWSGITSFRINRTHESLVTLRWIARAGFVGQLVLGTCLALLLPHTWFAIGYAGWSAGEVVTYPLRRRTSGDFKMLDAYEGHGQREFWLYAAWAAVNLITITW